MSLLNIAVGPRDHVAGDDDAPLTLVEFGDFQCPYCGQAYPIVKALQRHFGHELRLIYRHFPLVEMHPHAIGAASTAEFAATHGQFWAVHDALFENQSFLGEPLYERIIDGLGLSSAELRSALNRGDFIGRIRADYQGGVRSGVQGTPTFFINGGRYDGAIEERQLRSALRAAAESAHPNRSAR